MATLLLKHPDDRAYTENRAGMLKELKTLQKHELVQKLQFEMHRAHPEVTDSERDLSAKMVAELRTSRFVPDAAKAILDSTNTTTGNALIRQDLKFGAARV